MEGSGVDKNIQDGIRLILPILVRIAPREVEEQFHEYWTNGYWWRIIKKKKKVNTQNWKDKSTSIELWAWKAFQRFVWNYPGSDFPFLTFGQKIWRFRISNSWSAPRIPPLWQLLRSFILIMAICNAAEKTLEGFCQPLLEKTSENIVRKLCEKQAKNSFEKKLPDASPGKSDIVRTL